MKTTISFLIVFLLTIVLSDAQEMVHPGLKKSIPFISGEKLTYQVKYGFIIGGTATMVLTDTIYNKKAVFHAKAIGQTIGLANTIYGVLDIYESWFDKKTTLPYKQVRNIKEGRYTKYNEVTYNRRNNSVHSLLSGEHQVPAQLLDVCSAIYYMRRVDFSKMQEGDTLKIIMFFADEVFPFYLKYDGIETIRTKGGKISCIKISPVVEVGRMFKTQNDMTIWFTDDEKCLPVLIRMELRLVGAVFLKLTKYENLKDSVPVVE